MELLELTANRCRRWTGNRENLFEVVRQPYSWRKTKKPITDERQHTEYNHSSRFIITAVVINKAVQLKFHEAT